MKVKSKRFWLGLAIVLIIAAVPRLLSYDFSLPYIDHPDEPTYYIGGLVWRGLWDTNPEYFDGVPPAYLALHAGLQPVLESVGVRDVAATTQVMRLLSVAANLATLVFIALTARRAAGDMAGLVAGAAWGVSPLVLENGVYALPDPFIYLFTALALWLAGEAVTPSAPTLLPEGEGSQPHPPTPLPSDGEGDKYTRGYWCVWSVVAGLIAVLFKYPALPALLPGGAAALFILRRDRQRGARYLAIQGALVAVVGLWLVYGYGIDFNNLQREGAVVRESGLQNLLDASRVVNNLYYTFIPLQPAAFFVIVLGGITAFVVAYQQSLSRANVRVVVLCLLVIVGIPWLASAFNVVNVVDIRYVLPATAGACVLLGIAVGQIGYVVSPPPGVQTPGYVLKTISPLKGLQRNVGRIVLATVLLVMFVPQVTASWRLVEGREFADHRVALRQYVDVNLEPGTILVTDENHKTFNPFYGGIPYRHWVDWWMMESITEHSPGAWREDTGISYAALPWEQRVEMEASDDGRDYLARMLHLRDFFGDGRGPQVSVYRLWRMDVETDIQFGEQIVLVGYDQQPGESANFRFYWQATVTPDDNYSLFIHLTPLDDSAPLAQADGSPAIPERPTLTWDDPGETLISPLFTLPLDVPAGEYRVLVGLYNFTTGARLSVGDGDAYVLTHITVEEAGS